MDPKQSFVEEPRRAFVEEAAAAVDPSPPAAKAESVWERANPEGRVDTIDGGIILWNFAVGESELKPQHRQALELFAPSARVLADKGGVVLIEGHASATGEASENEELARQRALAVNMFLLLPTRSVPASAMKHAGAGERRPRGVGDSGEALARDRRVEVRTLLLARREPPIPPEEGKAQPTTQQVPPAQGEASGDVMPPLGAVVKIPFRKIFKTPVGNLLVEGEFQVLKGKLREEDMTVFLEARPGQGGKPGRLQVAFEQWVLDTFRFKATRDRLAVGWQAHEWALVELEAAADPDGPFALAVTGYPPEEYSVLPIGGGVRIVAFKLRVSFVPNAEGLRLLQQIGARLAARIAPWLARAGLATAAEAGGPVAAAVAIPLAYIGWIVWGFWNIVEAHREGREYGMLVSARRGYAQYLSCALTETNLSVCRRNIESLQWGERAGAEIGWGAAHEGWQQWSNSSENADFEKAELTKRLGGRKHVPTDIREKIFTLIGGATRGGTLPHPQELQQLVESK